MASSSANVLVRTPSLHWARIGRWKRRCDFSASPALQDLDLPAFWTGGWKIGDSQGFPARHSRY